MFALPSFIIVTLTNQSTLRAACWVVAGFCFLSCCYWLVNFTGVFIDTMEAALDIRDHTGGVHWDANSLLTPEQGWPHWFI